MKPEVKLVKKVISANVLVKVKMYLNQIIFNRFVGKIPNPFNLKRRH